MRLLQTIAKWMHGNPTSAVGLGVFRIAYGSVLLGEVLQLIYFRPLVFSEMPHLPLPEARWEYVLWVWAAMVVCLILGLYTRIACVVNYVLTLVTLSTFQYYEYHADHIYIGLNLLLIFTPVERRLSLDALRRRMETGTALPGDPPQDPTVARFHYDSLLLVGLGLVYFDSFFWKLDQALWQQGLGLWLPMSLPHDTWFNVKFLNTMLNRQALVNVLSDLTLVFEGAFIGLMWLRTARPILCLIGVGMHVSIFFAFPIPFFALSLCAMYLLLAPQSWYDAIGRAVRRSHPRCVVMCDADSVRWWWFLLVLEHFDFRGNLAFQRMERPGLHDDSSYGLCAIVDDREYFGLEAIREAIRWHPLFWPFGGLVAALGGRGWSESETPDSLNRGFPVVQPRPPGDPTLKFKFALVAFCAVMQVALIPKSPIFHPKSTSTAFTANRGWLHDLEPMAHAYFGVCSHGVFLDHHFENYDHIVAVTYIEPDGSETWLPLTRPSGQVGWYSTGRIWAKWAFRANAPFMWDPQLKNGLRDVTAFWAAKNGVPLTDARFNVLVKKYDPRTGWQRNFLFNQAQKPWSPAGTAQWKDGQFSAEVVNIEAL